MTYSGAGSVRSQFGSDLAISFSALDCDATKSQQKKKDLAGFQNWNKLWPRRIIEKVSRIESKRWMAMTKYYFLASFGFRLLLGI